MSGACFCRSILLILCLCGPALRAQEGATAGLQRLAAAGDSASQAQLADAYLSGKGVPQDSAAAFKWFNKAASQGNEHAEYNLGLMYLHGMPITKDYSQAFAWFMRAANQRNAFAEYYVGSMYANGQGVPQDIAQAREWYGKAANHGNAMAKVELIELGGGKSIAVEQATSSGCTAPQASTSNLSARPQALSVTLSHSKIDADDSDVAAMAQEIALAHSSKIPELEKNHGSPKVRGWQKKACQTGADVHDIDPAGGCTGAVLDISDDSVRERILLKGCSYQREPFSLNYSPCRDLGDLYFDKKRYVEMLALYKTSYAKGEALHSVNAGNSIVKAYKALGNTDMAISQLDYMCNWLDEVRNCRQLKAMGVDVDMQDALDRQRDRQRRQDEQAAEWAAMDAKMNEHIRQVHAETMDAISGAIDKTMASIQQTQANTAEARVNAAAIRMSQQNKGAGGYPTTSSGGSSNSGASSNGSTKPASKQTTPVSSDSSDSSSDADAQSSSASPGDETAASHTYNPYSTGSIGYNPYSGSGVPADGATTPGEKGHWVTAQALVGMASFMVRGSFVTVGLVNERGDPSQYGAFILFINSDKTHPVYYGFAGVVNEAIEPNTSRAVSWVAPYKYKDRDTPPFQARVTIRFFSSY